MNKDDITKYLSYTTYLRSEEAEFIYDYLMKLPEKGVFLELGTGIGDSTIFFAEALPGWEIYSVDAYGTAGKEPLIYHLEKGFDPEGKKEVENRLKELDIHNVSLIASSFKDLKWKKKINALYIDGTHYYEDVKEDFEKYSPFLKKDGIIIFDDYNNNWGVKEFVDGLKGWKLASTNTTAIIWK